MTIVIAAAQSAPAENIGYLVIVGALLVWVIGYWISLRIHPYRACRACKGGARKKGRLYSYAFGPCRSCNGTGRKARLGTRLFSVNRG